MIQEGALTSFALYDHIAQTWLTNSN